MWWENQEFVQIVERFDGKHSKNFDRRWMVLQLMRLVESVAGDTAECGCYKGCGSYLINHVSELQQSKRMHHVFDSFEGLSEPKADDGAYWTAGDLTFGESEVRKNLDAFESIKYYKGWIPDRFDEIKNERFCFVHIDVDLKEPTMDSLEFFYSRMNDGGIILLDDYGFDTCPGATSGIDEFFKDKTEKVISLSAGAGFMIKGLEVTNYASF